MCQNYHSSLKPPQSAESERSNACSLDARKDSCFASPSLGGLVWRCTCLMFVQGSWVWQEQRILDFEKHNRTASEPKESVYLFIFYLVIISAQIKKLWWRYFEVIQIQPQLSVYNSIILLPLMALANSMRHSCSNQGWVSHKQSGILFTLSVNTKLSAKWAVSCVRDFSLQLDGSG